ncbi:nucleolar complex-associated protein 2-like isoform X2 [Pyrus x bretschneideri]|uniref:nucleolar complex-associated protein 2-like isoform X2 n=1 Tax=Pyrus x bretschneideri TaxID=225117 RepID=UPI00202EC844|nr:nucleolar complex-associated protein 2-like isoform X2 [Pyrus x bretschneideri]XP_048425592.1 nucleolar complex-associated protein 2-like isoform X2 [Pyrus x bretschneideri]XP_048425593.1 nucleolar complex-associated protein 2-like isoform X2 [Pyrus x bretschneideri]XP_048425594.1 nucleolar complex-associated protein 2-like isoform X2 [Pyrus x bretschneideri]
MNCLELWTGAVSSYGTGAEIINGVAHLVPTARYFPFRLRCIRTLNHSAALTGTFTPVSMLLLDMLEMKELNRPTNGGVGKAIDLRTVLKIEANCQFTNERRMSISFLPNDPAAAYLLEDEKKSGACPLSKYVATLHEVAQQRNASLSESSVLVGEHSSVFGSKGRESDEEDDTKDDEGIAAFRSPWLPGKDSKAEPPKDVKKKKRKRKTECQDQVAMDEDIVQELVLSSDEEDRSLATPLRLMKMEWRNQLLRSWKARSRNALQVYKKRMQNLKQKVKEEKDG